jgi:hypothetical protein
MSVECSTRKDFWTTAAGEAIFHTRFKVMLAPEFWLALNDFKVQMNEK